ncbi:MAG: hypothetical protein IPK52_21035 [Chloroflexi bacterium]|nr:hypothetical protein [Chloroflexota bacterium]
MDREALRDARIGVAGQISLYQHLSGWALADDRPLASLVCIAVKQAFAAHERSNWQADLNGPTALAVIDAVGQ